MWNQEKVTLEAIMEELQQIKAEIRSTRRDLQVKDRMETLTMKEVREILQVSHASLYKIIREDLSFRTFKVGGSRRIRRQDFEKWMNQKPDIDRW